MNQSEDQFSEVWLLKTYFSLTPAARAHSCWTMSLETAKRLRYLKDSHGRYMFVPALTLSSPYEGSLLDLPVLIDESAVGISLREALS